MRKLLAMIAAVAGLVVGVPTTSSAGGWVVVSLDSMPAVHAGDDTEVGFTVSAPRCRRRSNSDDLAIVLIGPDGTTHRFEAVQQGAAGHHVATITLPDEGDYRWQRDRRVRHSPTSARSRSRHPPRGTTRCGTSCSGGAQRWRSSWSASSCCSIAWHAAIVGPSQSRPDAAYWRSTPPPPSPQRLCRFSPRWPDPTRVTTRWLSTAHRCSGSRGAHRVTTVRTVHH